MEQIEITRPDRINLEDGAPADFASKPASLHEMTHPADGASWSAAFPALARLDDDPVWRSARDAARRVAVPSGQIVFREGEACRHFLFVLSGFVRAQKLSEGGREKIVLYRVGPGGTWVLTTSCLFAVAGRTGFRCFVFASLGNRLAELMALIEAVAFGRVDARLAQCLLGLAHEGRVAATHQQPAAELGTAREVVSRRLKELERRGLVRAARGRTEIVDAAGLRALAGLR